MLTWSLIPDYWPEFAISSARTTVIEYYLQQCLYSISSSLDMVLFLEGKVKDVRHF